MIITITARAAAAAQATASSLALIALSTLVALLIAKEILSGLDSAGAKRLNSTLTVALIPLILVCVISATLGLLDVLS